MVPFRVPFISDAAFSWSEQLLELFSLRGSVVCTQIMISYEACLCQGSHVHSARVSAFLPRTHRVSPPPPHFLPLLHNLGLSFKKKLTPAGETRASHLLFICVSNANAEGDLATTLDWVWSQSHVPFFQMNMWNKTNGFRKRFIWCAWFAERGQKEKSCFCKKAHPHTKPSKFRAGFVCKIFRLV